VVDVPPKVPHPRVSEGIKPLVMPIPACAPGALTRIRLAGILAVKDSMKQAEDRREFFEGQRVILMYFSGGNDEELYGIGPRDAGLCG